MKKIFLFVIVVVVFSACSIWPKEKEKKISLGGQVFTCEIASTSQDRQRGLMHRKNLEIDYGMIFEFEKPAFHSFWMKDTPLALDIIWIGEDNTVTEFVSAPACLELPCPTYRPEKIAKYVVEVAAGTFTGQVGDKLEFID